MGDVKRRIANDGRTLLQLNKDQMELVELYKLAFIKERELAGILGIIRSSSKEFQKKPNLETALEFAEILRGVEAYFAVSDMQLAETRTPSPEDEAAFLEALGQSDVPTGLLPERVARLREGCTQGRRAVQKLRGKLLEKLAAIDSPSAREAEDELRRPLPRDPRDEGPPQFLVGGGGAGRGVASKARALLDPGSKGAIYAETMLYWEKVALSIDEKADLKHFLDAVSRRRVLVAAPPLLSLAAFLAVHGGSLSGPAGLDEALLLGDAPPAWLALALPWALWTAAFWVLSFAPLYIYIELSSPWRVKDGPAGLLGVGNAVRNARRLREEGARAYPLRTGGNVYALLRLLGLPLDS